MCGPDTCGPTQELTYEGLCKACADNMVPAKDGKGCVKIACTNKQRRRADGGCEPCPAYTNSIADATRETCSSGCTYN
jgi:hypothetical protein